MAIAYDNNTWARRGSVGTSFTLSHTCTGSNLVLLVGVITNNDVSTGVTYNGVAMTLIDKTTYSGTVRQGVALYYLINPATGANNVVASISGAGENFWLDCTSYTGCSQSTQPDNSAKGDDGGGTGTTVTGTETVNTANSWQTMWACNDQADWSAGAGTTLRQVSLHGGMGDSNGALTAGSHNLVFTVSPAAHYAWIIASIAPVGAAASSPIHLLGSLGAGA